MIKKILKKMISLRMRIYIKGIIPNLKFRLSNKKDLIYNQKKYKVNIFSDKKYNIFNGYYDINPIKNNLMLIHKCKNNFKTSKDKIELGYYNLKSKTYEKISNSSAWNWQQGSRLRWSNKYNNTVIFNDFIDGKFYTIYYNLFLKKIVKKINGATYDINNQETYGLSLNFPRLQRLRPGYGYDCVDDDTKIDKAPENDGIFNINFSTGEKKLIISLKKLAENDDKDLNYEHYINHISFSPSGKKFIFFHIYALPISWKTELIYSDLNGRYIVLDEVNHVSHYTWKNENELLITGIDKKTNSPFYRIYNVVTLKVKDVTSNFLKQDGHPTFIDKNSFITDTYPINYYQKILLSDINNKTEENIAFLYSDPRFDGEFRCDLHPKLDKATKTICVDSTFKNKKRSVILIKNL